jgi:hypothetical protein
MFRDELGHLEHAHLALTVKYRLECVVGVDHCPLFFVLETAPFDVVPELLCELRTWQWLRPNDGSQLVIRLDRSHECGIRFTLGSFLFGFRHGR